MRKPPDFGELQAHWYERLRATGFEDIEDTSNPSRPLREYHSRKFRSREARARGDSRREYEQRLARFLGSEGAERILKLMVDHGNCELTKGQARKIIELHREGTTERAIARKVKCSKCTVHNTIEKAREWMKVA